MRLRLPFSLAGQSGLQLGTGPGRLGSCRVPQRFWPHHDALAVAGDGQHVLCRGQYLQTARVEVIEIDGGSGGQFLHLPLSDLDPGLALDAFDHAVVGAFGSFDGGSAADAVGELLDGQVQERVGQIQVPLARSPVGLAGHADLAQDCLQGPVVALLDPRPFDTIGVHHL